MPRKIQFGFVRWFNHRKQKGKIFVRPDSAHSSLVSIEAVFTPKSFRAIRIGSRGVEFTNWRPKLKSFPKEEDKVVLITEVHMERTVRSNCVSLTRRIRATAWNFQSTYSRLDDAVKLRVASKLRKVASVGQNRNGVHSHNGESVADWSPRSR